MSTKVIHDDKWATIRYEPDNGYIHHTFHQPIRGTTFYKILNTGLDAMKQNKATKWLSDDRKNAEFTPEDIQFAVGDWGPRAAAAGWKHWALVVPESIAARAGMQDIVTAFYDMGVTVAIFSDLDKAKRWITSR